MKIAAFAPPIRLGDAEANMKTVLAAMEEAHSRGAEYLVLAGLPLCGCTCGSLLRQKLLIGQCRRAAELLTAESRRFPGLTTVLSVPEKAGEDVLFLSEGRAESCPLPAEGIVERGALRFALLRSPGTADSMERLTRQAVRLSETAGGTAVLVTPGEGESGTDGCFTGGAAIAAGGRLLCAGEGELLFADDSVLPEEPREKTELPPCIADPFFPYPGERLAERCERILMLQSRALAERMQRSGCLSLVLGLSGGLDSTWALLVGAEALSRLELPRERLLAVTMPGFGTVGRTRSNAEILADELGVRLREIPIGEAVTLHLAAIGHEEGNHNVTYENAQARERTQILMDLANEENALVLGTGDLSELALGWCTYNGDHMSMYAVNAALPKTGVRHCVRWYAENRARGTLRRTLLDVLDTPVSPELLPGEGEQITQSTEAILGPYALHDFFLWHFLRDGKLPSELYFSAKEAFEEKYDAEEIEAALRTFLKRFFTQQFKRSCLPDGPVLWDGVSLSPRTVWAMPSDIGSRPWIRELDEALGK